MTTAQELWDQTDNYRRKGGPDMPGGLGYFNTYMQVGCDYAYSWRLGVSDCDLDHAAAILRDHGMMWMVSRHIDFQPQPGTIGNHCVKVFFNGHGWVFFTSPSMLSAINTAIGAVLDEREGK